MRYINRAPLAVPCKYRERFDTFAVDVRGDLNREDVYFDHSHMERLFGFGLKSSSRDGSVWMETDQGRSLYMCYPELASQFRKYQRHLTYESDAFQFVALIDSMLDVQADPQEEQSESEWSNDLSDYSLMEDESPLRLDQYMTLAFQHKIEMLQKQLEIKERDLTILGLRVGIELAQKNETISQLERTVAQLLSSSRSEWI